MRETYTCDYCQQPHTNEGSLTCRDCDIKRSSGFTTDNGESAYLNECLGCTLFYIEFGDPESDLDQYCEECNSDEHRHRTMTAHVMAGMARKRHDE